MNDNSWAQCASLAQSLASRCTELNAKLASLPQDGIVRIARSALHPHVNERIAKSKCAFTESLQKFDAMRSKPCVSASHAVHASVVGSSSSSGSGYRAATSDDVQHVHTYDSAVIAQYLLRECPCLHLSPYPVVDNPSPTRPSVGVKAPGGDSPTDDSVAGGDAQQIEPIFEEEIVRCRMRDIPIRKFTEQLLTPTCKCDMHGNILPSIAVPYDPSELVFAYCGGHHKYNGYFLNGVDFTDAMREHFKQESPEFMTNYDYAQRLHECRFLAAEAELGRDNMRCHAESFPSVHDAMHRKVKHYDAFIRICVFLAEIESISHDDIRNNIADMCCRSLSRTLQDVHPGPRRVALLRSFCVNSQMLLGAL